MPGKHFAKPGIGFFALNFELGHAIAHLTRALLKFRGVDALSAQISHFPREFVLFRLQLLGFRNGCRRRVSSARNSSSGRVKPRVDRRPAMASRLARKVPMSCIEVC